MKQIYKLFFVAFLNFIFFIKLINCQPVIDTSFYYHKAEFKGEMLNGIKIGKWIEINSNGIIYSESYYDSSGYPTGNWIINFPDGTKRLVTQYKNHEISQVTIYRDRSRILDINSLPCISPAIYSNIRMFEDQYYAKCQSKLFFTDNPRNPNRAKNTIVWVPDHFGNLKKISNELKNIHFNGTLILYNEEGMPNYKYEYSNGSEYKTTYYYSGKRIKKQFEFLNDTLVKTIKFDKKGVSTEIK